MLLLDLLDGFLLFLVVSLISFELALQLACGFFLLLELTHNCAKVGAVLVLLLFKCDLKFLDLGLLL